MNVMVISGMLSRVVVVVVVVMEEVMMMAAEYQKCSQFRFVTRLPCV